jgi:hypothetical protein
MNVCIGVTGMLQCVFVILEWRFFKGADPSQILTPESLFHRSTYFSEEVTLKLIFR